jgi:ketosteroid isomerase-like protein
MSEHNKIDTAKNMYAAFARGDIPAVLEMLAPDVEYEHNAPPEMVPFGGRFRGLDEVKRFYTLVGKSVRVEEFVPDQFIVQGDDVVVVGHNRGSVIATGREVGVRWAHILTFRNGLLARLRMFTDTATLAAAFGNCS